MRKLWLHLDSAVAQGRDRPLLVQRVRVVRTHERQQQTADEATEANSWGELQNKREFSALAKYFNFL